MKAKGMSFGNYMYGSCWRSRIECEGATMSNVRDLLEEVIGLKGKTGLGREHVGHGG